MLALFGADRLAAKASGSADVPVGRMASLEREQRIVGGRGQGAGPFAEQRAQAVTDQQRRGGEPLDAEGAPGPETVRELQEKLSIRSDLGPPDQRWAESEGVKGCIGDLDRASKGAHESSAATL
jgi:hypothetical protein